MTTKSHEAGKHEKTRSVTILSFFVRLLSLLLVSFLIWFLAMTWSVVRGPRDKPDPLLIVNDVTRLNPINVAEVITPTTTEEIVGAIRSHNGPISIGGARHSMGGQTAAVGGLFIDMRQFNRILEFSPAEKTITVQAGTRWRQIQELIDESNLSVKIMQSYANFTVGGSLSVNAHGRYVGLGPIVMSVKSLKLVLADGGVVVASPRENTDIFYGTIGGYGGLGVIVEATLELTDNLKVKRQLRSMLVGDYRQFFFDNLRGNSQAVFHNANLDVPGCTVVNAITYSITPDPVTIPDRLSPLQLPYDRDRFAWWVVSEWPLGKTIRRKYFDPNYFGGEPVSWRNYEASYDTDELEPVSRERSTYVLEEYFVPVDKFDEFVLRLRTILAQHKPNILNVSIRHSTKDPGTLLAWARSEVFAFVIYYKQETTSSAQDEVGIWTRALIDAAIEVGGSYYLPYQLHATPEQFRLAYPRWREFVELKRRVDPTNKFRSVFLDKYLKVSTTTAVAGG